MSVLIPLDLSVETSVSRFLVWPCPCQLAGGKQLGLSAAAGATPTHASNLCIARLSVYEATVTSAQGLT